MRGTLLMRLNDVEKAHMKQAVLRVPARFEERASFDAMAASGWLSPKGMKAMAHCREFAASPRSVQPPLLIGASGTGKTHLIYATARAICASTAAQVVRAKEAAAREIENLVKAGGADYNYRVDAVHFKFPKLSVVVTDGADMAHEIRSSAGGGTRTDEVVARFRQETTVAMGGLAALFVDDVEVFKMGDWVHEEMYRILDYRYQESLPTMFASNFGPGELKRHLGDRLVRRMLDMTEPFEI